MSLFDLQDVCIAIGSIATLDLPMVVDLIGIYGLKGPYCTLTTTNWFLQALSVIPRGSWGDVARRSYHDPLGRSGIVIPEPQWLWAHGYLTRNRRPSPLSSRRRRRRVCRRRRHLLHRKIVSGQFDEENPFVQISSVLLVQADEGVSFLVVDRIGDFYRNLPRRADVIVTTVLYDYLVSGRGPDWRYLPQSTVKCRFLYETGRSQARVASKKRKLKILGIGHRLCRVRRPPRREHERERRLCPGRAWRATAGHVQRDRLRDLGDAWHRLLRLEIGRRTVPRPRLSRALAALVTRLGRACRTPRPATCLSLAHWLRNVEEGGVPPRAKRCSRNWRTTSTWSAALVAAARASLRRAFFRGGSRRLAAAPAKLRRCRDG
ncbi:hypothetical protein F511_37104 [Dorcoceras hygrometricum]|uniref:Helicase domain-containing family protein n=1 Tax=Dorcoceras hygrometricum TaxID=472368 RepID=A0A2Z7CX56_9LAMI|nr:hypothetical protein F511_37104 [Dorcoceras hygrometricum]